MRNAIALVFLFAGCSPSGPKDIAGENKDVRVDPNSRDGGAQPGEDTYQYVAKRPHGIVALAEARNMSEQDARALIDHLADELEQCATRLEAEKTLVEGAARIVAIAQPSGPPATKITLAPGGEVAQNALICLVAPLRATPFPKGGMAVEYKWGPNSGGNRAGGGTPL